MLLIEDQSGRKKNYNLHEILPKKKGFRRNYGGTISEVLKRGTLVVHSKWRECYVGGSSKGKISLHNINNGKRLCQNAKIEDLKILTNYKWILT